MTLRGEQDLKTQTSLSCFHNKTTTNKNKQNNKQPKHKAIECKQYIGSIILNCKAKCLECNI